MGAVRSLKEQVRHHQREIRREVSRVERQIYSLQDKRKRQALACKRHYRNGDKASAQALVKQIVQTDRQIGAYRKVQLNCTAMEHQLGTVQSTVQLQRTLKASVKVMSAAASVAPMTTTVQNVKKYMRRIEENETSLDFIDEACQSAFGDELAEEDLEKQVMEELEIDLRSSLPITPRVQPVVQTWTRPRPVAVPVSVPVQVQVPVPVSAPASAPVPSQSEVYDGVAAALQKRLNDLSKFDHDIYK